MKNLKLSLLAVPALAVLLSSCPEPLSEDVVVAAEDRMVPSIDVISPSGNDAYYSQVDFSLEIMDDAKSEGDGKGDLASIEFSVSNDDFRGGRIEISGASVTQDSSAGPDSISYDSSSGLTTFSFSTVDPNPLSGFISVTVKAVDRNGNETEERISLSESPGPWVEVSIVDDDGNENKYIGGDNVHLSGSLGNSSDEQGDDDEVYSISWSLADTIRGELILDRDATYEDPYNTGSILNYYNEAENRYERLVRTIDEDYADYFYYYPATRRFEASPIYMIDTLSGTVLLSMTVTDLNGHETESNLFVSENTLGPALIPKKVDDDYYSHFSTATGNADEVTGTLDITTAQITGGGYFRYSLQYDGQETGDFSYPGNGITINDAENKFSIDYRSALGTLSNYAQLSDGRDGEEVKIYIEAAFNAEQTSNVLKKLVQDNAAPTITGFSFAESGGGVYANHNSTIDFGFNISENRDLIDDGDLNELSMTVRINGTALETGTAVTTGARSFGYTGTAWSDYAVSGDYIPYTITLADRLGNAATYDNDSFSSPEVRYYDGRLASSTFLTNTLKADDDGSANAEDSWARQGEDVLLSISSSRDTGTPSAVLLKVNGNGGDAESAGSTAGSGTFNYSAAYSGAQTSGPVTMEYSITDAAGNAYNVSVGGVTLDAVQPVLTGISYTITGSAGVEFYGGNWYLNEFMNNVKIVVDGLDAPTQDDNLAGVIYKVFNASFSDPVTLDGDADLELNLDDDGSLSGKADGSYTTPSVRLVDLAGNESADFFVPFRIDTTDPTLNLIAFETDNGNSSYARRLDNIWVTFEASDANGMDPAGYTVSVNGSPLTVYTEPDTDQRKYSTQLTVSEADKEIPFAVEVRDNAGNTSQLSQADAGTPVKYYSNDLDESYITLGFTALHDDGGTNYYAADGENFSLTLGTARDLEAINGSFNGSSISNPALNAGGNTSFSSSKTGASEEEIAFDFTGGDVLRDKAGNTWSVSSHPDGDKLYYDGVRPVLTGVDFSLTGTNNDVKEHGGDWYINGNLSAGIKIVVTGLDGGVDGYLKGIQYKVFEAAMSSDIETGGAGSYELALDDDGSLSGKPNGSYNGAVRLVDWAGNTSLSDLDVPFDIDKTDPVLSYVDFSSNYTNSLYAKVGDVVSVTFEATDSHSDLDTSAYVVSINGNPASYDSEPAADQWKYTRTMSTVENDKDMPFSVTVEDAAGNTSSLSTADAGYSGNTIRYYSRDLNTAVTFTFSAPYNYGNDYFAKKNANFSLQVSSSRDLETYNGIFNGDAIGPTTLDEGESKTHSDSNNADDTQSEVSFSFTGAQKLVDKAGNEYDVNGHPTDHLYYDSLAPTLSSVTRNGYPAPATTRMTLTFSELLTFSSASSAFSLSPSPTGEAATGTSPTGTILIDGTYADDTAYTLTYSGVRDRAGNAISPSSDTINNFASLTHSGIGSLSQLSLTIEDDGPGGSSGSSGSYKQRPGRMSAEYSYTESPEGKETLSAEARPELSEGRTSMRTESLTIAAGADTLQRPPSRVVNRPDLNTGIEALSRAMEQVERNRAEYRALLTELTPDEMNMGELLAMNEVLEPEIYEPLTLKVSASPLVAASAGDIELSLTGSTAEEESGRAAAYLVLKILIALTGIMVTALFLLLMKRLQK